MEALFISGFIQIFFTEIIYGPAGGVGPINEPDLIPLLCRHLWTPLMTGTPKVIDCTTPTLYL